MSGLDVIAIIVSLASLLFVVYQSAVLRTTLHNQIFESFVDNSLKIDDILITYPELRKYIYYGAEVNESTPDLDRIMSVVELIVDTLENLDIYKKYIPKDRLPGWINFMEDMKKTPAYRYYCKKHSSWYETE